MQQQFSQLWSIVWTDWLWLPGGATWKDLQDSAGQVTKAKASDLWMSLVAGILLLMLRFVTEVYLLRPLSRRLLLATSSKFTIRISQQQQQQLEAACQQDGPAAVAESLDSSQAAARNWLRQRQNLNKKSVKFAEAAWQMLYYTFTVMYGIWLLYNETYLYNSAHIWMNWPQHEASNATRMYYMIQLGFYYSALATIFHDTWRKDSMQMAVHHIVTIFLMVFSYSINIIRVGNLILLLHDMADPLLNAAKLGNYLKVRCISDTSFAAFAGMWVITRLVIYPFFIVRSALTELPAYCGLSPALVLLQILLIVLQVMHIVWTYFIAKIALRVLFKGHRSDSRSDSENSDSDDDDGDDDDGSKRKRK